MRVTQRKLGVLLGASAALGRRVHRPRAPRCTRQPHSAPDGRLYLCEDGSGGDNIVSVDHDGSTSILAQNNWSDAEWAGACFSEQGHVLFVNMQGDANKGPLRRAAR